MAVLGITQCQDHRHHPDLKTVHCCHLLVLQYKDRLITITVILNAKGIISKLTNFKARDVKHIHFLPYL